MQVYDQENGDYGEFETMLVTIITHDGDNDDNVNDDNENTDDENIDDKDENDDNEENSDNDDTGNDDNLREFPWPQPGPASPHTLPPRLLTIQDWWGNII